MSSCLLLLLLSSWSLLVSHSHQCETAVAFVDSVLSVPRSLMANADVALLKAYNASSVNACLEECCTAKYGACSVASFKKNTTSTENCIHFNCRPLPKCKFLSSPSTNSFSFSSNPTPVPLEHSSSTPKVPTKTPPTSEGEQFALKNDNKTVKPRKGVDGDPKYKVDTLSKDDPWSKSGIKPRKGVNFQDDPNTLSNKDKNRSNVKARKGVGPYSATDMGSSSTPATQPSPVVSDDPVSPTRHHYSAISDDLVADLAKILEDDSTVESTSLSLSTTTSMSTTPEVIVLATTPLDVAVTATGVPLLASEPSRYVPQSTGTPRLQASPVVTETSPVAKGASPVATETSPVVTPTRRRPAAVVTQTLNAEYSGDAYKLVSIDEEEEAENDRKYKSSIHLVLSLVFGLLVLFAVLGVVAKRVYDGWLRRDYYRMNYLIDGIYNGVD